MERKTGKEYQDDYRNAMLKVALVEARVQKRALELCKANPDVVIQNRFNDRFHITGQEFYEGISSKTYTTTTEDCLAVIMEIEQYLANKHPHQQGDLFLGHKKSENAVRIANPETKDKRDYGIETTNGYIPGSPNWD